ncbi:MAG: DUF2877 domain-containing protein [Candidatus Cloacimonas sp.]|jgi:hypothetical protein|nr:DUF2877 domain-containing protein [Candidatus Cloacimonas sp.]
MESINNIGLLSVGACVPEGRFQLIYSHHAKVINFSCGELIVSVCTRDYCPGAFRIILDADLLPELKTFTKLKHSIIFDSGKPVKISDKSIYLSLEFHLVPERVILQKNIEKSFRDFSSLCSPESIYSMVSSYYRDENTFSAVLANSYRQGIKMFRENEFENAVKCFKRKGIGLTPAGDDFLVGFLISIAWMSQVQKNELSKILKVIFVASVGNDPLVNTFLTQAVTLKLDEDWAMFLTSLGTKEDESLGWMTKIISHGSSSGSDELSGFYLACSLYCNDIGLDY